MPDMSTQPKPSRNRDKRTLVPITYNEVYGIEYSAHSCTMALRHDLELTYSGVNMKNAIVILTFQPVRGDLTEFGAEATQGKDHGLDRFTHWAEAVRTSIIKQGHWADYTDPSSGVPTYTQAGACILADVPMAQSLLGYQVHSAGACGILSHPRWGTSVYPASMVTTAPRDVVIRVLQEVNVAIAPPCSAPRESADPA